MPSLRKKADGHVSPGCLKAFSVVFFFFSSIYLGRLPEASIIYRMLTKSFKSSVRCFLVEEHLCFKVGDAPESKGNPLPSLEQRLLQPTDGSVVCMSSMIQRH